MRRDPWWKTLVFVFVALASLAGVFVLAIIAAGFIFAAIVGVFNGGVH
jgi:hypothetical protein